MKSQYLYVITRANLSPGLQAAQVAHAAFEFALKYPAETAKWNEDSNYIVILTVIDEPSLLALAERAQAEDVLYLLTRDEDVGDNEATALAVAPGEFYRQLAALPLALREVSV